MKQEPKAENEEIIVGRNSVMEALKSGRSINKILVAQGDRQGSLREIIGKAKEQGLVVQTVDMARLDALGGPKHQGVAAMVAPVAYVELDDLLQQVACSGKTPFLVLLDELEDPHNVGAILRTADAAGVQGMLLPKRRTCPLSGTVAKTSAGAVEYVPVARIGNVAQTLKYLQQQGYWIIGADMEGDKLYHEADLTGPVVVVVGSEGKGLGRLTKECCDLLVRIPMAGNINSLNASVACSLLLYEIVRQRGLK
ncbi:23S rRNA (guanosine(2251)-2'-O)-methyltransferase RlmB [Azotosporobacter soli]|uniref:23S rRNA (guanosine(2251)-2'-O)-methyltransferase RlmB n=1 Tax=Azotosporobacter soli TaxID=3055040 RepID=UPI0031FE4720